MSAIHDPGGHDPGAHDAASQECADFLERIVYFLDNELDDADVAAVRIHLDSCHPCLETYDVQRTIKTVVARSCSEVAPSDLRDRVRVRISEVQIQITEQ